MKSNRAASSTEMRRLRVPRTRRGWIAILAIGAPFLLAGCNAYPSYFASTGVTKQGNQDFRLYSAMTTIGLIIGGIVVLLILWAVFRYRKRSDEIPKQTHENLPIEIVYTVLPVIIVAILFYFTVLTINNVTAEQPANATVTSTGQPVLDITVTAFQWGWRFDYPHLDVEVIGETTHGPQNHGPQMVVPVGERVQITLVSNDVIHGFYLRDFDFSRYAQPGVTNIFDFNVMHTGTYDGQCTQFCGLYHSEMLFSVRSVTPSAFRAWAHAQVASGHTLQPPLADRGNTPMPGTKPNPASSGPTPVALSSAPKAKAST